MSGYQIELFTLIVANIFTRVNKKTREAADNNNLVNIHLSWDSVFFDTFGNGHICLHFEPFFNIY